MMKPWVTYICVHVSIVVTYYENYQMYRKSLIATSSVGQSKIEFSVTVRLLEGPLYILLREAAFMYAAKEEGKLEKM